MIRKIQVINDSEYIPVPTHSFMSSGWLIIRTNARATRK